MPEFIALKPILHDGKTVQPGEPLSLTSEEAAALIRIKAIPAQDPEASPDAEASPPPRKPAAKPKTEV